jgi:acyl-homoserine lactone acylase PvdQ
MWDPSYRTRRINEILAQSAKLTPEQMQVIQNDVYDKAAERFLPTFLAAVRDEDVSDSVGGRARSALQQWNYVADRESPAPLLWLRWLEFYRDGVWKDEWATRGIKQPGGSWGFTGDNHREPMLEVLEYLTREFPDSAWFDDHTTPEHETRDDIIRRTFRQMTAAVKKEFGEDPSG